VRGGEYGVVHSLSPRVNVKYTAWEGEERLVSDLSARFGWGKSVKLPAFSTLYPAPSYTEKLAFAPGAMVDGTIFYAYHIMPEQLQYNPDLKWQYSTRQELAVEAKVGGVSLSLVFFRGVNRRSYTGMTRYTPFSYKLTDQTALEACPIAPADRAYSIDRNTGVVTVTDKTGALPARELEYRVRNTFTSRGMPVNGSPSTRQGVEWVVDFGKIRALNTSVRWDGSYYDYKGIEETITCSMPNSTMNMADGNPYKYVGFYAGSSTSSNGSRTKRLTSNVTVATHIPAARLVFSLRVEASLYASSRSLSEYGGRQRGFVLESKESYMPSATETDIYGGNRYIGLYPLYYTTFEDMETKIPFAEKFAWAMENDRALYNELAKMVVKTNYLFMLDEDRISPYCSANISVTKEIGNFATISFNATNATHNMGRVTSSRMNTESSLYGSGRIPAFYYGLSLKLKL
jgi:hypothetical protein